MNWTEVRNRHPSQWLVVEAIGAKSVNNYRVVEEMSVVDLFGDDGNSALHRASKLNRSLNGREFYMVHTAWEKLEIKEQFWAGLRHRRNQTEI